MPDPGHDDPASAPFGPSPAGPVPRVDPAAVARLRDALDETIALLGRVLVARAEREGDLAGPGGWRGGHRLTHDRREQQVRELGGDLDAALRQLRERLEEEVAELQALRAAAGRGPTTGSVGWPGAATDGGRAGPPGGRPRARTGWTTRTRVPCLLRR